MRLLYQHKKVSQKWEIVKYRAKSEKGKKHTKQRRKRGVPVIVASY